MSILIDIENLEYGIDTHDVKESVIDIASDPTLLAEQKKFDDLEQVQNQYCFLCGETPVTICFAQDGVKLGEKIKSYFLRRRR